MNHQELAQIADVSISTITSWKKERPELIKLIELGKKTEQYAKNTKEYFNSQKDLLEFKETSLELKEFKTKKVDLAKRFNTTSNTLTNWEKTKPELIRIINLALATERHMKEIERYLIDINQ